MNTLKQSFLSGLIFSGTVLCSFLVYAAWTPLPIQDSGDVITFTQWNNIINRLNSIDQKQLSTAWVNFDGTNCTGGVGANECTMRDQYNVTKVVRINQGRYEVYFLTPMDNSNYITNLSAAAAVDDWTFPLTDSNGGYGAVTSSVAKTTVAMLRHDGVIFKDSPKVSVITFGGKN